MYSFVYNHFCSCVVKTMKISEEIAETLRDEIVAGIYKPRERLIEEELSDRFFVSRTPIREALKQLESAELVVIEPYKGAFIADKNPSEIRDIYELRCVLEAFTTELAVPHITADIINQMQRSLDAMNAYLEADDKLSFARENELFHSLILEQCPNKTAAKMVNNLWEMTAAFRRLSWRTASSRQNSVKGHQNILAAIKAGDAKAAGQLASKHIRLYLNENFTTPSQK